MRRAVWILSLPLMVGLVAEVAQADPKFPQGDARRSMGNHRLPGESAGHRVGGHSLHREGGDRGSGHRSGPDSRHGFHHGHHPKHHGYRPGGYYYRDYYPQYGYPYYPDSFYYYSAPLYIPAEELYGPEAVKRFMGVDHWFRPQPKVNIIVPPAAGGQHPGAAAAAPEPKADLRGTGPDSVALAWKFIGYGDAHFSEQRYLDAYQRYRKAARAAPKLADAYFRQGYALAGMGRYDLAVNAIERGLDLDPRWPGSKFDNRELFEGNDLAKNAQLDAMAKAAEQEPHNADLLFLLGVLLHFDDQPDRAEAFFNQAAELGGHPKYIRLFTGGGE